MKMLTVIAVLVLVAVVAYLSLIWPSARWALFVVVPLAGLLVYDITQTRHTILRNYPVFGHLRYFFEDFRTHIRQYFIQGDDEGVPFYREQRAIVYQRAKREIDSHPFGSIQDMYAIGYEWMNHSIKALEPSAAEPRILVGGEQCTQPYSASRFNISAMSFGALSASAIQALNRGAREDNFFHNTGEGGISQHHLKYGGDLVWEIGTGYFGCRDAAGKFDEAKFSDNARRDAVKMIEIKLSQGAKPGGGGLLPGVKVTPEIAAARGVPEGKDVHSPATFDVFSTPVGLLDFVQRLREVSGGKPTGFKLCIGRPIEFMAVVKAMLETEIIPDFITIDGSEGGTGAAQQELSDSVGMPLREGLVFANNVLIGAGVRQKMRLIASGKVITGFDIASKIAMGAELCNSARGFMFALGCIQARVCNKNICPTGITTMNKWRTHGLVVEDKYKRVAAYHEQTIRNFLSVLAACGMSDPSMLEPGMLNRRVAANEIRTYHDLYPTLDQGELLDNRGPALYRELWHAAKACRF